VVRQPRGRSRRAQQPNVPMIGLLNATTATDSVYRVSAFRDGLKEAGFVDGHNVAIDFRSAKNKLDRLPALAADLVHREAAVIVGPSRCCGSQSCRSPSNRRRVGERNHDILSRRA